MTEKRYRVGLLGCGGIAHTHARSILKTGRMELVAFCDMAEHRAKEFNERYAQGSGQVGVDGVLLVCPYYNRPNQEGLYQHFKTVSQATSLPVILYNIPSRTGRNIEASTTLRLAEEVQGIVGVKEASGDMKQVADICAKAPDGFAVWSGNDEDTFHIVALGGVGVISVVSHICGQECRKMIEALEKGDLATARKIHFQLMPLVRVLFPPTSPNPAPIKAALNLLGFKVGNPRLPLVPCTDAEVDNIRRVLQALGKL